MPDWNRRSVLATGGVLTTGSLLASVGITAEEDEETTAEDGAGGGAEVGAGSEAADSHDWASYRGNAGNTNSLPAEGEFSEPDTVAWEYDEGGSVAVVDGTVYVNTGSGIHALDDADGSVEWTTDEVEGLSSRTPAVGEDTVYVSGEQVVALEASSGEIEWTFEHAGTAPTVAGGMVYVVSDSDDTLYALDAETGDVNWERESVDVETGDGDDEDEDQDEDETEFTLVPSSSPVAAAAGSVYAIADPEGTDAPGVVAFDAASGETEWTHFDEQSTIRGPLLADADEVYAVRAGGGGRGPVLDAETGEVVNDGRSFLPAALGEESWIATTEGMGFTAYERGTGGNDERWSVGGATLEWSPATIVGETVVVFRTARGHDDEPELVGFDIETGEEQWAVTIEFDWGNSGVGNEAPTVAGETVYLTDDTITAIRAGDEESGSDGDSDSDEGDGDDGQSDEGDEQDDETDEGDDTDGDDTESDCPDDAGSDCEEEAGSDDDDGSVGDDGGDTDGSPDDGSGSGNETGNETAGSEDGDGADADAGNESDADTDAGTEDDSVPGFTTGAGIVGGALGLEWVRRRTSPEESVEE